MGQDSKAVWNNAEYKDIGLEIRFEWFWRLLPSSRIGMDFEGWWVFGVIVVVEDLRVRIWYQTLRHGTVSELPNKQRKQKYGGGEHPVIVMLMFCSRFNRRVSLHSTGFNFLDGFYFTRGISILLLSPEDICLLDIHWLVFWTSVVLGLGKSPDSP